ncbi:unnamed protein product, partial [Rotaria sp. Silwood2]
TLSCSTTLINVTITITLQKIVGARYTGMFNSFPDGSMSESHVDNGAEVIYTWTNVKGQTIGPNRSPYKAVAQFDLIGTSQPTSGDTYTVMITTLTGQTNALSGHF